jgi:hypothetical protein
MPVREVIQFDKSCGATSHAVRQVMRCVKSNGAESHAVQQVIRCDKQSQGESPMRGDEEVNDPEAPHFHDSVPESIIFKIASMISEKIARACAREKKEKYRDTWANGWWLK